MSKKKPGGKKSPTDAVPNKPPKNKNRKKIIETGAGPVIDSLTFDTGGPTAIAEVTLNGWTVYQIELVHVDSGTRWPMDEHPTLSETYYTDLPPYPQSGDVYRVEAVFQTTSEKSLEEPYP